MKNETNVRELWKLDRKIPIGVVAVVLLQTLTAIWWIAKLDSQIIMHHEWLKQLPEKIVRLEERISYLHEELNDLEKRINYGK